MHRDRALAPLVLVLVVLGFDMFHYYFYNPTAELDMEFDGRTIAGAPVKGLVPPPR